MRNIYKKNLNKLNKFIKEKEEKSKSAEELLVEVIIDNIKKDNKK